jgi:hypothetical protein
MRNDRGPWYLLTGVVLGVLIGLAYAWVISPVRFVDNPPSAMREDFKDQYRALIAIAYTANQDIGRAQARLVLLGDADSYRVLAAQAQRALSEGGLPGEAHALGDLAAALRPSVPVAGSATSTPKGGITPTVEGPPAQGTATTMAGTPGVISSATPPTLTSIPTLTRTPLPTRTPTPTAGLPFELVDQSEVCDPDLGAPLIQVFAEDVDGSPVPGVALVISWVNGEEQIFTGLKPELGLGYADFTMDEGIAYSVQIPDGGLPVMDLIAQECEDQAGERYLGSWVLRFRQP